MNKILHVLKIAADNTQSTLKCFQRLRETQRGMVVVLLELETCTFHTQLFRNTELVSKIQRTEKMFNKKKINQILASQPLLQPSKNLLMNTCTQNSNSCDRDLPHALSFHISRNQSQYSNWPPAQSVSFRPGPPKATEDNQLCIQWQFHRL
jgi:hypothetical protein